MTNVVRKVVGSPKPPPDPDPEVSEAITRREQRAVEDERRQKRIVASRSRSRRRGQSQLMAPGIQPGQTEGRTRTQSSLGYARNPTGS